MAVIVSLNGCNSKGDLSLDPCPTRMLLSLLSAVAALQDRAIPNQYIVVFKDHVQPHQIAEHHLELQSLATDAFSYLHHFSLPAFSGYAARLPQDVLRALESHPDVDFIEQDKIVSLDAVLPHHPSQQVFTRAPLFQQDNDSDSLDSENLQKHAPSWGLPRISSRDLPTSRDYEYPASQGTGVDVYIIDTGIFIGHPQFQGRATLGKSFTTDGNKDGNGHGTHVAGTIGSLTYGVAKNVSLIAVKVLDAQGSGTTSGVLAGVEWAAKQVAAKKNIYRKSVANLSLGGPASVALDRAVKGATNLGLVFAVAAGFIS